MSKTITKVMYREENGIRYHKIVKISPGDPNYEEEVAAKKAFEEQSRKLNQVGRAK